MGSALAGVAPRPTVVPVTHAAAMTPATRVFFMSFRLPLVDLCAAVCGHQEFVSRPGGQSVGFGVAVLSAAGAGFPVPLPVALVPALLSSPGARTPTYPKSDSSPSPSTAGGSRSRHSSTPGTATPRARASPGDQACRPRAFGFRNVVPLIVHGCASLPVSPERRSTVVQHLSVRTSRPSVVRGGCPGPVFMLGAAAPRSHRRTSPTPLGREAGGVGEHRLYLLAHGGPGVREAACP